MDQLGLFSSELLAHEQRKISSHTYMGQCSPRQREFTLNGNLIKLAVIDLFATVVIMAIESPIDLL